MLLIAHFGAEHMTYLVSKKGKQGPFQTQIHKDDSLKHGQRKEEGAMGGSEK